MAPNASAPGGESDVITRADLVRNTSNLMTAYAGRTELTPADLIDTLTKVYGTMAQISGIATDAAPQAQLGAPASTPMLAAPTTQADVVAQDKPGGGQTESKPLTKAEQRAQKKAEEQEAKARAKAEKDEADARAKAAEQEEQARKAAEEAEAKAKAEAEDAARPKYMGAWIVPDAEREKKPRERGRPPLQEKPIIITAEPPAEIIEMAKKKGLPYARIVMGRPDLEPKVGVCKISATVKDPTKVICLEDGEEKVVLKRHLRAAYNMDEIIYRARWGLPDKISIVATDYQVSKREQAKNHGLGKKTLAVAKSKRSAEAVVDTEENNVVPVAAAAEASEAPKKMAKVRRASDASKKKVAA